MNEIIISTLFLGICLWAYIFLGGADFGMGVIELFFPKQKEEIKLVSKKVIGPIWEANHIWLIIAIVILFVGFPELFFTFCIYFHLPIFLMLIGIIIRGTAFSFLHYDVQKDKSHTIHHIFFNISSIITPIVLGMILASFMEPLPHLTPDKPSSFLFWIHPFSITSGLLLLFICILNALCFLHYEKSAQILQQKINQLYKLCWIIVQITLSLCFFIGNQIFNWFETPYMIFLLTGLYLLMGINYVLIKYKYKIMTYLTCGLIMILFLLGFAVSKYPILIETPEKTFLLFESTAPAISLIILNISLTLGLIIVIPLLIYLIKTFKQS